MNKVNHLFKDILFKLKMFKYNQYRIAEARSRSAGLFLVSNLKIELLRSC